MKYSQNNKPLQCYMTQSSWYKGAGTMQVKGILWHSTGANNPSLSRYIQPDDKASNRDALIKIIGENRYKNDWNHIELSAGVNAFIGQLANGQVATIQAGPWDKKPWGCGSGSKGSCNNGWIQFEICEDSLSNPDYFNAVYKEAVELTAYLCDLYKLDPMGTVKYNGVSVPVILCHRDSHLLGLGSNHGDVLHWFPRYGKSMEDVRSDVKQLLDRKNTAQPPKDTAPTKPAEDYKDAIQSLAKKGYLDSPAYWINACAELGNLKYLFIKCDKVLNKFTGAAASFEEALKYLVSLGVINSPDYWRAHRNDIQYLQTLFLKLGGAKAPTKFPYKARITASMLNYRLGPSTNYRIRGTMKNGEIITIISEMNGWGQLQNNIGWVCLDYVKKI